jgi:hypothetical protein
VEALAGDLSRHLDNRPVRARPDSTWYRLSRFVRRNPSGFATGVLLVISAVAGLFSTLWETRILIDSLGQTLPPRTVWAPFVALVLYIAVAGFGVAVYLSRAVFLRTAGALAGGCVFMAVWSVKLKVAFSMGWWRSTFGRSDALDLFFLPAMLLIVTLAGGILLLTAWRVSRRFGWIGQAVMLLIVPFAIAVRDRIWWQHFMHAIVAVSGILPLLADAAFLAIGLALGYAVMRVIAGPARSDSFARASHAGRQVS